MKLPRNGLVLLASAALALCAYTKSEAQTGAPPTPAQPQRSGLPEWHPIPVGQPAPDFAANTPDGHKVSLSDLKGKVVILDFWATWCGPCQVSMPGLENVYQQIKNDGVVVLSLNTWDEKEQDFKDWVAKNSGTTYHFDFVRDPAEGDHAAIRKNSIAKRLYHVIGIPTMYVIDREGNVAGSTLGSGSEGDLVKILGSVGVKAHAPAK